MHTLFAILKTSLYRQWKFGNRKFFPQSSFKLKNFKNYYAVPLMPTCKYMKLLQHAVGIHRVKNVEIRSFFWSVFACIWTEYVALRSKFSYSVRKQENTDQKKRICTFFTQ